MEKKFRPEGFSDDSALFLLVETSTGSLKTVLLFNNIQPFPVGVKKSPTFCKKGNGTCFYSVVVECDPMTEGKL